MSDDDRWFGPREAAIMTLVGLLFINKIGLVWYRRLASEHGLSLDGAEHATYAELVIAWLGLALLLAGALVIINVVVRDVSPVLSSDDDKGDGDD